MCRGQCSWRGLLLGALYKTPSAGTPVPGRHTCQISASGSTLGQGHSSFAVPQNRRVCLAGLGKLSACELYRAALGCADSGTSTTEMCSKNLSKVSKSWLLPLCTRGKDLCTYWFPAGKVGCASSTLAGLLFSQDIAKNYSNYHFVTRMVNSSSTTQAVWHGIPLTNLWVCALAELCWCASNFQFTAVYCPWADVFRTSRSLEKSKVRAIKAVT